MVSTINLTKGANNALILLLIFSVVFTYSCKKDSRPAGILSRNELADLMVELYIAEGKLSVLPIKRDSAMQLFLPFERSVMERRKISDEVLRNTYKYYFEHPREYEQVYDAVIDTLSLRETRNNTTGAPR